MLYIFEIEITDPDYTAEQYAESWLRASALIQQAPGALGTRLHRKIDDPKRLLAVASWDSKSSRDAMDARDDAEIKAIIATQIPHVRIHFVGEFEDPEWLVLPPR